MAAGSIVVDLLMRTGQFSTDTKRAERALRELQKEAEQIGKAIGAAFVAVGAASILLVKSAIDAADATSKLAQQTGTTVEELSALTYAAGLADISQQELGGALVKLTKNMSDAAGGTGEAIKGFEALKISVKNADGTLKGSDQVLTEIAEKFAGMRDGAEKTALAVNLFGKSGAQLIPLLNAGASGLKQMKEEALALGVVLDTDMAKSAEEFNDNLTRIGVAIAGIGNRAATELLPALNDVSSALVELAKNEAFVSTTSAVVKGALDTVIAVFQTLAVVGSDVGFVFLGVGREIGAWAAQIAALGRLDLEGFSAISDAVKEDGARARAELDKFQARIMSIGRPSESFRDPRILGDPGSIASQARAIGGDKPPAPRMAGKADKDKVTEAERYLENLQKQIDRTRELTTVAQLLSDIESGRLKITGKVTQKRLEDAAQQIDAAKYEAAQRQSLEDAIVAERNARIQSAEAAMAEAKSLVEGNAAFEYEIKLIGADTQARRALEKARISSAIAVAKDNLATIEAADTMGLETQAIQDQIKALERRRELLGDQAAAEDFAIEQQRIISDTLHARDTIEGTLGQGLEDALDGNFKSIGDLFLKMLKRMVAEAIAADIMNAVFGKDPRGQAGSGLGGLLQLIGGLVGGGGGADHSQTGEQIRGRRAGGGDVHAGGDYWVGEKGPERFRPSTSGRIIPNDASMGSGRGGNVYITNNSTAQVSAKRDNNGDFRVLVEAIKGEIAADVGSGTGKVASAMKSRGVNLSGNLAKRG